MNSRKKIINGVIVPYNLGINELQTMLLKDLPSFTVSCAVLSYMGDNESLQILTDLLKLSDLCRRRLAVEAIGNHALGKLASKELLCSLDDKVEYVVRTTCNSIGKLALKQAHEKILLIIQNKKYESYTRKLAVSCLNAIWEESDFPLIKDIFYKETSKEVVSEVAYLLKSMATKIKCEEIIQILINSPISRNKIWACELISMCGPQIYSSELEQLISDKDGHVRKAVSRTITAIS